MNKGEVWVYHDLDSDKRRPCVIVGNNPLIQDADVLVAKLTSHPPRSKFDVVVTSWKEAGLTNISCARCTKLFTLKADKLLFRVATIEGFDLLNIKVKIAEYILD